MPSHVDYQNNYKKNSKSINQFAAPKNMSKKTVSEEREEKLIDWITFYRRNIHRFIEHYYQIYLFPYQRLWVYEMNENDGFITIASRGTAKSWILGLFGVGIGTLYPNSEIIIVASTKEQAGIIISKIARLREDFPNFAREIKDLTSNNNKYEVVLHNGSTIKVVPAKDSARGNRATFIIYEEFRLVDKQILDSVIRPFAYSRQVPYLKNPKYSNLIEEPKEVFISSAYHKILWWYQTTVNYIKMMAKGKSVGFIAFDYLLAIKHGIKTKAQIQKEREDMDEITFLEEYENIPWGENADAYFKLDMFKKNRNIKRAFYPQKKNEFNPKKNPFDIKRSNGEIRVLSVDIAAKAGAKNDNTIISCARLIPTHKGYQIEIIYMESHNGENTVIQSLRIKQIRHDFDADYIILDLQNVGVSIFDQLSMITKDEERGLEYEALTVMPHDSIPKDTYDDCVQRTLAINANPIIYPINGSAEINNNAARDFKERLKKGMISFLIDEIDAEDYFIKSRSKEFTGTIDDVIEKSWYLHPYVQITLAQNECVSLALSFIGEKNYIKLKEPSGGRKDRYTSLAYLNYFVSFLDKKILKEDDSDVDYISQYLML